MTETLALVFGKVIQFDPAKRTYEVSTADGRQITGVRKIGDVVNNTGGRKVAEIEKETEVLLVLKFQKMIDAPDAFILGAFESFGAGGKMGTTNEKEAQIAGMQGFLGKHGRRLLLYPDGTIEFKAGEWCNIMLDPSDNEISSFFQKLKLRKDRTNFIEWDMHPDSEDMKDALLHIGFTGKDSMIKEFPDIEILAGALVDLDPEEYIHSDFDIDPGAKLAMRITNSDGKKQTDVFHQIGDLGDGSILYTQIKKEGGINAEVKIGDMEEDLAASLKINEAYINIFNDGRYVIVNDKTEIEATNDGIVNIVCEKSNLGQKDAKNHIAIAEEVIDILTDLIAAIQKSTYLTVAPGSPTKPGPINAPEFTIVKNKLKKIISKSHSMDK